MQAFNLPTRLKTKALVSKKTTWKKGRNFYDIPSQKIVTRWVKTL